MKEHKCTTINHRCNETDDDGLPLKPDVATCGRCGRSWCFNCDPCPAALCHWCHGRGYSTAPIIDAARDRAKYAQELDE